ncbi:hypothetical protein EUAN_05690 [Andreesenia angusta]|uniref:Uncharacterized protein n=1 Tax=Andreesenia angusta TaxID=39480 RepID=A0A1S1V8Q2_9FIRM|nr:hypothetical protein [Andreesenia angusta]OHW62785.1 hypothetical protein EUAN_05690 [Andreesenia angusta]
MGLSPIDMKGFIPKTQELSEAENQRNIRDKSQLVVQQSEQEKKVERDIRQVNDSENAEKARIRKEPDGKPGSRGDGEEKCEDGAQKAPEKNSLEGLNVSVKSDRISVGRKIDMKV